MVELDDAPAHRVDDALVVGGHHHRRPGAVDAIEEPHDPDGRGRVEVSGRLVGEQDQRAVDERAGDRHPLLLAAGELGREVVGLLREADEVEDLRHLCAHDVLRTPDHLERERDVLVHGLVRQELEVLEHAPDVAPELRHLPRAQPADVAAGDQHAAARGDLVAQQQLQEGRLARPGRADEEDELALQDLEREVPQGDDIAFVRLGDVFETNHVRRSIGGPSRVAVDSLLTGNSTGSSRIARSAPMQVRLDEGVEIAVEHGLHVPRLVAGPLVLHELVRRERVRADLIAEGDVLLVARQPLQLAALLLALTLRQPGREDLHGLGPVLELRTLVLARHDHTRGDVRDPHRGVGDVDVLTAGTRRPVRVDAEVVDVDLGLLGLFQRGDAVDRRERGLAAGVARRTARSGSAGAHRARLRACRRRSGPSR